MAFDDAESYAQPLESHGDITGGVEERIKAEIDGETKRIKLGDIQIVENDLIHKYYIKQILSVNEQIWATIKDKEGQWRRQRWTMVDMIHSVANGYI